MSITAPRTITADDINHDDLVAFAIDHLATLAYRHGSAWDRRATIRQIFDSFLDDLYGIRVPSVGSADRIKIHRALRISLDRDPRIRSSNASPGCPSRFQIREDIEIPLICEEQAKEMTDEEIDRAIFHGAGPGEYRGPTDALTPAAIRSVWWQDWRSERIRGLMWSAIEALADD